MEETNDWREASDWDDPLQVAYLFQDMTSSQCGHAVQWNPRRFMDLKACPICHQPISLIQQGPSSPSDNATPTILFKYGKHIYRLMILPDPRLPQAPLASWSSWWWWWFPLQKNSEQQPVLVQDRIKKSLQLADGFKILHKGKIVYPMSSSLSLSYSTKTKAKTAATTTTMTTTTTTTTTTTMSTTTSPEHQVSQLLLQLSSPSLLVMGTFLGQELSSSPQSPPFRPSFRMTMIGQLFQWSWSLFYSTIHSVWVLIMTSSWSPPPLSFLRGTQEDDSATASTTSRASTATGSGSARRSSHNGNNRPHSD